MCTAQVNCSARCSVISLCAKEGSNHCDDCGGCHSDLTGECSVPTPVYVSVYVLVVSAAALAPRVVCVCVCACVCVCVCVYAGDLFQCVGPCHAPLVGGGDAQRRHSGELGMPLTTGCGPGTS